ncbi:hypothetical protein MJO29_012198 [Puccinia striiformis f. sp. tritici]|nr:hypothetical protein MJO29_012198 [Puccinia striiformis f. sp. tritici]
MQDSLASDEDSETSTSSSSESEEEQQQGDWVVLGFDRLRENYVPDKYRDYAHMLPHRWGKDKDFHPDELDLRKDISNRLRSNLLPQLRQQLSILSEYLDPTRLEIEPESTLELILDKQSELYTTLHQIVDALNNLRSESDPLVESLEREDDGHLKEFKGFRMVGLDNRFGDLLQATTSVFKQSQKLIRKLELSTQDSQSPSSDSSDLDESPATPADIAWIREQMIDSTRCSDEAARCMIEWIEGSDTQLIQYFWNHSLCFIDRRMRVLLKMIGLLADLEGDDDAFFGCAITSLREPDIQLALQLLPIMKLSRLLFKKLLNNGMNSKRLPFYTNMSSSQLTNLSNLPDEVTGRVSYLVSQFKLFDYRFSIPGNIDNLRFTARMLEDWLESKVPCVSLYLLPLSPDTDGFSTQNHLKDWLKIWSTQFGVAIQNFLDAINLYVDIWNSSISLRQ